MSFTRARTQVLTRLMPGALFIHDDYGVCQVVSVDLDPTEGVNATALLDAVRDYLAQWDAPLRAGYVLDTKKRPISLARWAASCLTATFFR